MNAVLPAPEPTTETITLPVRCRPDQSNWRVIVLFVGIFGLFGLLLCVAGSPPKATSGSSPTDLWLLVGLTAAMFLGFPLLFGLWLARATIIADETGLRWRGMGRWQFVAWDEVRDYYNKSISSNKSSHKNGTLAVVETGSARLKFSSPIWKKIDFLRLQGAITECATSARPKEWGVLGTRPDLDWPRTFRYETKDNRAQPIVLGSMMICMIVMLGIVFIPDVLSTVATMGWGWGLVSLGMLAFLLLPTIIVFSLPFSVWRATRRRFGEQIEISRDGLCFTGPKRQLDVSWHEITDYYIAPRKTRELAARYCVVTAQGSFDFIRSINEAGVLTKVIYEQSPLGAEKKWAHQLDEDTLGGPGAKWSSGCEGVGERVYHYRTRTNRALLWMPTTLSLAMCLQPIMASVGLLALKGSTQAPIVISVLFGGLALWGWYRYFTASVQISGAGITQFAPFRKKHIAWGQIEKFYKTGDDAYVFGNVIGLRISIRFWLGISDVKELKEEVARRAVNATGSWKGRETETPPQAEVVQR